MVLAAARPAAPLLCMLYHLALVGKHLRWKCFLAFAPACPAAPLLCMLYQLAVAGKHLRWKPHHCVGPCLTVPLCCAAGTSQAHMGNRPAAQPHGMYAHAGLAATLLCLFSQLPITEAFAFKTTSLRCPLPALLRPSCACCTS